MKIFALLFVLLIFSQLAIVKRAYWALLDYRARKRDYPERLRLFTECYSIGQKRPQPPRFNWGWVLSGTGPNKPLTASEWRDLAHKENSDPSYKDQMYIG